MEIRVRGPKEGPESDPKISKSNSVCPPSSVIWFFRSNLSVIFLNGEVRLEILEKDGGKLVIIYYLLLMDGVNG